MQLKDRDVLSIRAMLIGNSDGLLGPSEEEALRCLIRLVVLFKFSLHGTSGFTCVDGFEFQYNIESIFSAIEDYVLLRRNYNSIEGALRCSVYDVISIGFLRGEFDAKYEALCSAGDFMHAYKLLLDLYDILIIVGGLCYNQIQWPIEKVNPTGQP